MVSRQDEEDVREQVEPGARRQLRRWVIVDILMMAVLVINLTLIVFDMLFRSDDVQAVLHAYVPRFFRFYSDSIHEHFALIDLGFVALYLTELVARWVVAVRRGLYDRWYVYPLAHWYDVLGSIPVGSLRFLRILRIIAIVYRLQRLQLIDLRQTWLYSVFEKYKNIVTEEISDRVVVRVLDGVQKEIGEGSPVVDRLWREVILPRKDLVMQVTAVQLEHTVRTTVSERQEYIRGYIDRIISDALRRERSLPLENVPILGDRIARQAEQVIRRVVGSVVDQALREAAKFNGKATVAHLEQTLEARLATRAQGEVTNVVRAMVMESIDILKEQVQVQQWKLRDKPDRVGEPSQGETEKRLPPPEE
jgi:hypothetical protein